MSAPGFKLDVPRILRINAEADRREEISAEDIAYLRECFEVISEIFEPLVEAYKKAVISLAEAVSAAKEQAATSSSSSVIEQIQAAERRAAIYASTARPGVNNMTDVARRAGRARRR